MLNKTIHTTVLTGLLLLILSCERQTDWELQKSPVFPVADCILTNELKHQALRLYWSADRINSSPVAISGAAVRISDDINSVVLAEAMENPGTYRSVIPFIATAGKTYRLTVSFGDVADTAYASMSGVTPLEAIDITGSDGYFRHVYHQSTGASMTEIYYDWSADALYCDQYGACQAAEVFYSLDNIDPSKEFAPERQKILFPHSTTLVRRKYSLDEQHQRFIRSLLLETEWRGGFFDVEQGNVPTNFRHGVHGWFAACAVDSDTTFFE